MESTIYDINPGEFKDQYLENINTCSEQELYLQIAQIELIVSNTIYISRVDEIALKKQRDAYTVDYAK